MHFFLLNCLMGTYQRSEHISDPGLVEEIALKQTKERADMKSICKVPMSYGGRQCAFLLWLLNMSQLPRKMSFPLDFLSVALIGYWGVFRL